MSKILVFLDDERKHEDVTWVNYNEEFSDVLLFTNAHDFMQWVDNLFGVTPYTLDNLVFSFDHDIQSFDQWNREQTGYDCVKYMIDDLMYCDCNEPFDVNDLVYYVHSKNPVGKENIITYIENFKKHFSVEEG